MANTDSFFIFPGKTKFHRPCFMNMKVACFQDSSFLTDSSSQRLLRRESAKKVTVA